MTCRDALQTAAVLAPVTAFGQEAAAALSRLPNPADELEPSIDARTMEIHHGKAYVDNLNKALAEPMALASRSRAGLARNLAAVPGSIRPAVRNNGGGHAKHCEGIGN
jgi:superoxide dismutase, Fe-Mn family